MRPLHLLGLMPPEYRFFSPDGARFMVPGSIRRSDHEILLAFFQQVITEKPLPRVEIDWYTMLLEPSRIFLEHTLEERGSSGTLLVVKVREQGVDLREILANPMIRAFQHVAITNVHPGSETEELRSLLALTQDVRDRARERYEELTERLGLREDGWSLVDEFVRNLESPIDVLETVNALIEVQIEKNPPEEQQKRIFHRMLVRLLEWRSAGEFCALVGLATEGLEETRALLGEDAEPILAGLRVQGIFRDGKLRQWAAFLERRELWEGMFGQQAPLPTDAQLTEVWAEQVRKVVSWTGADLQERFSAGSKKEQALILKDIFIAARSGLEGKHSHARELLARAEQKMLGKRIAGFILARYWFARATIALMAYEFRDAEAYARQALSTNALDPDAKESVLEILEASVTASRSETRTPPT